MLDLNAISSAMEPIASVVENAFIKGRVLQYDADFACYECAWLDKSVAENIRSLKGHIEVKRLMVGAEFVNNHITVGMKGGRNEMATVKPYQEKRSEGNLERRARAQELRNFLVNYKTDIVNPVVNMLQEADDSLTQYQHNDTECGDISLSVIMSGDKDLWMSMGWHADPKDGRMYLVDGYGRTEYRDVGNKEDKLVGEGTSWFWHQMLLGDGVDNIAGLETLSGALLNRYLPTKKYNAKRKPAACGEAKAVAILNGVTTDIEAAKRVLEAYTETYGFTAKERLVEQAFLLWMRRTSDIGDCVVFLNSVGIKCQFSPTQKRALKKFKELALIQIGQSEL
jgi:hypothetical protein